MQYAIDTICQIVALKTHWQRCSPRQMKLTNNSLIGSAVIENGTGFVQTATINTILATWGLLPCIVGMVMDTTVSNTGMTKGAASKLKQILKRPVLWIGCRHHTCELHIKHDYIACCGDVFTKGKDNQLFK